MSILKGVGEFFALDIGTTAIRVVQLSGSERSGWGLLGFAHLPVPQEVTQGGNIDAKKRLGEAIATAVLQSGIRTRNVALGLPANKSFATVIDVPNQAPKELAKVVGYQVDQYVPMAIDEAQVDWALLGQSPVDPSKAEVLVTSTAIAYAEERMEFIEALGFNLVGMEPETVSVARSLTPFDTAGAQLVVDLGETSTDVIVSDGGVPRLIRSIPGGLQFLYKSAMGGLGVDAAQARQFVLNFGLAQDKLEGRLFRALEGSLETFAGELVRTVRFFQQKYTNTTVSGLVLAGYGGAMPFFAEYMEAKTGIKASVGNPWQRVNVPKEMQAGLAPVASEFAVAVGLAERSGRVHG